jgi:PAS domain S-box-containing protein
LIKQTSMNIPTHDTHPGFWEWNIAEKQISSPILMRILGYEEGEVTESRDIWRLLIHPDDWGKLVSAFKNHIENGLEEPVVEETRFFHKTGSVLYILLVGKVTDFGPDGTPLKMVGTHIDITGPKYAEMNLRRVNNLLSETSRTAMVGGWEYEIEANELIWTDFMREIFEVDAHFVPKKGDVASLFTIEPERDRVNAAFSAAVTRGIPFDIEFPIITAKGNRKWVRCTCQSTFEDSRCTRLFGSLQDITEKSQAKEELWAKKQQLVAFIKHSPVAICMLDNDLNYITASDIWKTFLSVSGDISERNHLEVFPGTPEIWVERYRSGLAGNVLRMDEESYELPDGTLEWLEWEIRPWSDQSGEIGGIIIVVSVISEKHAFKEALIKAKNDAEQSSLIKSRFLSMVSHEIRTPLNAVIGFINLLMQDPRSDQVENMNVLRFSAENLLLLINDILDFSKLEADKVELEEHDFDLKSLLHNIVSSLKQEAGKKHLWLELATDPHIPEFVKGDSARLGQILINLINNAIKFTHEGGVSITCQLVETSQEAVTIIFEVKDTGIGISLEQQAHIFDMFSQADSDTTRKYGGTGLGLSISKRLLELMGSQIRLSSAPFEGATFSFKITFKKTESVSPDVEDDDSEVPSPVLDGARVLIVEDNTVNILLMQKFLTHLKCDCSIAKDGNIAYEMVKEHDYDLILMDLQMPVMDGYTATRKIRELPGNRYQLLPIIALSANDKTEIETKLKDAGMTDLVTKPFSPKILKATLARYLEGRSG